MTKERLLLVLRDESSRALFDACREDMRGEEESGREKMGRDCLQARGLGRPFQAGLGGVGLPSAGSSPLSACTLGTVWSRRLALESTNG